MKKILYLDDDVAIEFGTTPKDGEDYAQHIRNLPKIPIVGGHEFEEGQVYEEGKDYEFDGTSIITKWKELWDQARDEAFNYAIHSENPDSMFEYLKTNFRITRRRG